MTATGVRHFTRNEFRCPHCGVSLVRPRLLELLEVARALHGEPLRIVSGYRCPPHNAAVGGAKDSQHMYASAADLEPGKLLAADAQRCGFTGIGRKGVWAVHVDVRDGALVVWSY